jgi:hypothetical protein
LEPLVVDPLLFTVAISLAFGHRAQQLDCLSTAQGESLGAVEEPGKVCASFHRKDAVRVTYKSTLRHRIRSEKEDGDAKPRHALKDGRPSTQRLPWRVGEECHEERQRILRILGPKRGGTIGFGGVEPSSTSNHFGLNRTRHIIGALHTPNRLNWRQTRKQVVRQFACDNDLGCTRTGPHQQ